MSLTLNFEFANQAIANQESVTYASAGSANTVSITDAIFYPDSRAEGSPSAGVYVKYTGKFTIRNTLIGTLPPKPADTITRSVDGSVWTVLRAHVPVVSGVWQLDVIDLILSNGLTQTGSLTRPSNTLQDSAGRQALTSYTTIASSIVCRVQPIGGDAVDLLERRGTPQRFRAFLGQQVTPQALDVFTVSGQAYTVLGFKMPQRIDELMTLDLELIDQGGSANGAPAASVNPQVSGIPLEGNTLTCAPGTWSLSPTFAYQWFSAGVAISGANSSSYTLQASDLGNFVYCQVTATAASVSGVAVSNLVGPVTNSEGVSGTFPP